MRINGSAVPPDKSSGKSAAIEAKFSPKKVRNRLTV
jgi:hypothetical protein